MPNGSDDGTNSQKMLPARREQLLAVAIRELEESSSNFTSEQWDKIIEQRGDVYRYIHEDKKDDRGIFLVMYVGAVVFAVFVISVVAWRRPDYIQEVIAVLVGLVGGFGLGRSTSIGK